MVVVGVFYLGCWALFFALGVWLHAHVNHGELHTDDGPGPRTTATITLVSAVVAVVPLVLLFAISWLAEHVASL